MADLSPSFPEISIEDIEALLVFLPVFQHPDFKSGEWINADGQMLQFRPSEKVEAFTAALYEHHWIIPIDWEQWLLEHPQPASFEHLAGADLFYIRCLFTALVRSDLYEEGALAEAIENKAVTAILRRLKVIWVLKNRSV
jgi:ADP-ribosyl-[dinitrogen reductase] hydrolase